MLTAGPRILSTPKKYVDLYVTVPSYQDQEKQYQSEWMMLKNRNKKNGRI